MKKLLFLSLVFLSFSAFSQTKNIVPNAGHEGTIGTSTHDLYWAGVYTDYINGITPSAWRLKTDSLTWGLGLLQTGYVARLDTANASVLSRQRAANTYQTKLTTSALLSTAIGGDVAVVDGGTGTSTGSITGTGALVYTAGGTNQNVTLTPSGTGYTILNGNVGIGTTGPGTALDVAGTVTATKLVLAGSTSSLSMTAPGFFLQGYSASDSFLGNNIYYNGGSYRYIANGFASFIHFQGGNVRLQIAPENSSGAGAAATLVEAFFLKNNGNIGIGTATIPSMLTVEGLINMKNYTVSTLPAGTRGDICYVTDALAPTFLAIIVGGGAVVSPVFFNGTNWVGF